MDYVPGLRLAFFRFGREVEELIGRHVEVATETSLRPLIREQVLGKAVRV